eukprot:6579476-Alexandrium_andersonii.AAC.1
MIYRTKTCLLENLSPSGTPGRHAPCLQNKHRMQAGREIRSARSADPVFRRTVVWCSRALRRPEIVQTDSSGCCPPAMGCSAAPVSYTHLTLPTICSV